jgi:hypothetical protein
MPTPPDPGSTLTRSDRSNMTRTRTAAPQTFPLDTAEITARITAMFDRGDARRADTDPEDIRPAAEVPCRIGAAE